MALVNNPATQCSACTALGSLLEILCNLVDQYLQLTMEHLSGLLETIPISVKAAIVSAISSIAHASKEHFLPYLQPTMDSSTSLYSLLRTRNRIFVVSQWMLLECLWRRLGGKSSVHIMWILCSKPSRVSKLAWCSLESARSCSMVYGMGV